jgi:hypothetical protein
MIYDCCFESGKRKIVWQGEMHLLSRNGNNYELEIRGRGTYFHVIIGSYKYGNFLCIPNHDIGCELSTYSDIFWNTERLRHQLKKVDAVTVASALCHLGEL